MPSPRLYTDGRGHEEFRRPGREGADDAAKHHRILAYAWGILESPHDRLEVDHLLEVPWLNIEANLTTRDAGQHGRRTRAREQERRLDPEKYAETVDEVLA